MPQVTQDVDPETFYAAGRQLFDLAGSLYRAFHAGVTALGQTTAMAGSDDDGTAWARSYDTRVHEVLGAVNELTVAMENYGGVMFQAGYNHAIAEYNATVGHKGPPPVRPTEPASTAGVLTAPPSAGGPGQGLLDNALGLVEQLGVPVPDGDTGKLDKAAQTWAVMATVHQTTAVVDALGSSAERFADTSTPEVDYIATDLRELHDVSSAILTGCGELSQSCRDYRSALDELRTNISDILEDLTVELAVTAVIGIAAAFITFGVGAAAGTAKAAHTISKFANIVRTAINTWKIAKNISNGVKRTADITKVRT